MAASVGHGRAAVAVSTVGISTVGARAGTSSGGMGTRAGAGVVTP